MEEILTRATEIAILVIDAMALIIIVYGSIEAFLRGVLVMANPSSTGHQARVVWVHFARWLVAALTFQLAADILETTIAPGWEEVGRLAVIAVVRTFLNYFLERDLEEVRTRDLEGRRETPAEAG